MRFILGITFLSSVAFCQLIPNVILTGEPRVIARRIISADMKAAQHLALPDDKLHERQRVNILNSHDNPTESVYRTGEERPVVVYRRILRPARITFTGEGVVTDRWEGMGDAVEMESWTLGKRPTLEGTFVQTPLHH